MRRSLVVLVLAACGGKPVAPAPPPPPPRTPTVVAVTCAEVAVLLRGPVDEERDPEAGPARERAVRATCEEERWPTTMLECVASKAAGLAQPCFSLLTEAQLTGYERRLAAWAEEFDHDEDVVEALPDWLACRAVLGNPGWFPPVLADDAAEREWAHDRRHMVLEDECDHGWSEPLKSCVRDALRANDVENCLDDELDPGERAELRRRLTEIDTLAGKIAAARRKPATIGCKQVVAAHYGDARWKTKLDGFKGKERKRLIAESRAKMTQACTAGWDDTLRACIVAGGDSACFEVAAMGMSWGYPAAGVAVSLGVPECDAYAAMVQRLLTCDKLPQATRDAMRGSFEQMQAHMAGQPAADRAKAGPSCKAGAEATEFVAKGNGC